MSRPGKPPRRFVPVSLEATKVPCHPAISRPATPRPVTPRPTVPSRAMEPPPVIGPDIQAAETELTLRLKNARLRKKPDYTTGQTARILGISRETVRQMIIRWEPPGTPGRHPASLFAYRLGSHRRVPRHAILNWLADNTAYLRDMSDTSR